MIQLIETDNDCRVLINGEEIEILDADDDYVLATCGLGDIDGVSLGSFPKELRLEIRDDDSFGTKLFEQVTIYVDNGEVVLEFNFHIYSKYWESFYGLSTFIDAVHDQVMKAGNFEVVDLETYDPWKRMTLRRRVPNKELILTAISKTADELKMFEESAEIALGEKAARFCKKKI